MNLHQALSAAKTEEVVKDACAALAENLRPQVNTPGLFLPA
jgi:hypothetical protein